MPTALLALRLLAALLPAAGPHAPGVVVERVEPGGRAEHAGLRPGDVLESWNGRALESPFDLLGVETVEAPRHAVTLRGRRGGDALAVVLRTSEWGLLARPGLTGDRLEAYESGRRAFAAGRPEAALAAWTPLAA